MTQFVGISNVHRVQGLLPSGWSEFQTGYRVTGSRFLVALKNEKKFFSFEGEIQMLRPRGTLEPPGRRPGNDR